MPDRRFAVLLGAGASYGAWQGDSPSTPPLGGSLFDALQERFPASWGSLSKEQTSAFAGDDTRPGFEEGMRQLWEREFTAAPTQGTDFISIQRLLIDMGVYFASFIAPNDLPNCYAALIDAFARYRLIGPRLGIATMNYECLLEMACASRRVPVDVSPIDPHPGALTVWKPHGACNLVVDSVVSGNIRNNRLVANKYFAMGSGLRLVAIPPGDVAPLYSDQLNIPPAMSLYASGKHSPTAPDQINAARQRWMDWSRSANIVISIGARFNSDDTHIWSGVVEGRSQIWFVGNAENARTCEELTGEDRFTYVGNRFDTALSTLSTRLNVLA